MKTQVLIKTVKNGFSDYEMKSLQAKSIKKLAKKINSMEIEDLCYTNKKKLKRLLKAL